MAPLYVTAGTRTGVPLPPEVVTPCGGGRGTCPRPAGGPVLPRLVVDLLAGAAGGGQDQRELFATLDLVGQAPGGPEEDPVGFPFGGWQAPLISEVTGAQIAAAYEGTDALLLGRRTYDIFAAYWPHQDAGGIATLFNSIPKYVASRGRPDLSWAGSTLLGPDLAGAVREIRDRHEHVKVVGSLDLVQTLLRERLFDRIDLWVHPIMLGVGKKVFDGGAVPTNLTLLDPPVASPNGTVYLRYGLADGTPATGDMTEPARSAGHDD
jgi:dihydrofolate reductase